VNEEAIARAELHSQRLLLLLAVVVVALVVSPLRSTPIITPGFYYIKNVKIPRNKPEQPQGK
jgi:hypothetical protein